MRPIRSLTEGSIARELINFALPILFVSVLLCLNASVNSMWVGRYLGEAALAATANGNAVIFLLVGGATGVAMAAAILVGQCIGANNILGAKRVVGTGTTFFAVISAVIAIASLAFSEPILAAMKTPADAFPLAAVYTHMMLLALPSLYIYSFVISVLRAAGDSKTPLYFLLLSGVIDIVLNPAFIFGVGPIPRLGIAGSALATVMSQTGSLVALVIHLYRDRHLLCLRRGELSMLRVDWAIAGMLIRKGIPASGQILVLSLSGFLMITLVNRLGVDTAASYGASMQLWLYVPMISSAAATAASTMAAHNIGAKQWDRVRSIAKIGLLYSVLGTSCIVLATEMLGTYAFEVFLPIGSPTLHIASHINRIATWSWVFSAASTVLFGVTRAAGSVMPALLISMCSLLIVRFPLAEALLDRWQADGIWWSFPISSALEAILACLYYKCGGWRTEQVVIPISTGVRTVEPRS